MCPKAGTDAVALATRCSTNSARKTSVPIGAPSNFIPEDTTGRVAQRPGYQSVRRPHNQVGTIRMHQNTALGDVETPARLCDLALHHLRNHQYEETTLRSSQSAVIPTKEGVRGKRSATVRSTASRMEQNSG